MGEVKALPKIIALEVVGTDNYFKVGTDLNTEGRKVGEIEDGSKEWEDKIDFIYWVKDEEGELIKSIENCPVVVTYDK